MAKVAVADVPGIDARLATAFEVLAESPDGVSRMRELVLSLAVRGQLVPQDPMEETGHLFFERVQLERQRLESSRLVRREESLSEVAHEDQPHPVPPSWAWARLGLVAAVLDHLREPVKADLRDARVRGKDPEELFPYYGATQQQGWIDDFRLDGEFVLLGEDGVPFLDPSRAKAYLVTGKCWVNNHAHVLQGILTENRWLLHWLNRFDYEGRVTGTTRAKLTKGDMVDIPVALPPLAEQRRIVARVDELMAWIDQFEAARNQREAARIAARDACLATLCAATNPTEVAAAWSTLSVRFDSLFSSAEEVPLVRQSLRRLAITGRLVNQRVGAPPAADLLGSRCIAGEGAIPTGWAWSSLDRLGEQRGGGTPTKARADYWKGDVPWVSPKDMKRIDIVDSQDHISDAAVVDSPCKLIPTGSVLMVVRGMILAHSFPVAINRVPVTINQDMKALVPFEPSLAPFLRLALQGMRDEVLELVDRSTHGTCKLRTERLFSMPIAVPPSEEQQRIMNRLDELMTICDRLQSALATAELLADELAAALATVEA